MSFILRLLTLSPRRRSSFFAAQIFMKYLQARNQSLLFLAFFLFNALFEYSCALDGFTEATSIFTIDSNDHLEEETYETIMKRFDLKKYYYIRNINLSSIIEKRTLMNIIAKNFIEAHFDGWNKVFKRTLSSDTLINADRFNKEILYDLMKESKVLIFLGYELCFVIIDIILKEFAPRVTFCTVNLQMMFQSISLQISDFLEFVLNNLVSNQHNNERLLCLHDDLNNSFEILNRTVTMAEIAIFQNVEILEVILKRYSESLTPKSIHIYINDAKNYFNNDPLIFRQVFTLLVKMTPEYFLAEQFLSQYTNIFGEFVNITIHLANMAPIFRALMMLDPQEYQETYLESYYNRICPTPTTICFKSLDTFRALDILILDSNFSLCGSLEIKNKKLELLSKILSQYYGISRCDYFDLAKKCVVNGFISLYEVILQHFSAVFAHDKRIELLRFIITESLIKNTKMAIVISLSYFDFDTPNEMLEELDPETNFINSIPGFLISKLSKVMQVKNFEIIREIIHLLVDCPIKCPIPISVDESFVPIAWSCPESLLQSENLETFESRFPYLYMYALVLLVQKFRIPIYSVSIFGSNLEESVVWSETIGFINFMIDRMGAFIGLDREKLFKFIDTTEY